jgi:hypothetical protein
MRLKRFSRLRQSRFRQRETQKQAVIAGIALEQRHDLRRAIALEQEIGVGAEQIGIARIERERGAEKRFGGDDVAPALRDFAGERGCPFGKIGAVARKCGRCQCRAQRAICGLGLTRYARRARIAGDRDQRHRQLRDARAIRASLAVAALNREHGRAREQRLAVVRISCEQALEVGERTAEIVRALLERGAQQQRSRRWIRIGPPRSQRGLRLAEKARIAGFARSLDRAPRESRREGQIGGTAVERCAQALDVAQ